MFLFLHVSSKKNEKYLKYQRLSTNYAPTNYTFIDYEYSKDAHICT